MAANGSNSLPYTVWTFQLCNQRVCCLLFGVVRIYERGTCARCAGLVPCCGQDGYQAQVPQLLKLSNRRKKGTIFSGRKFDTFFCSITEGRNDKVVIECKFMC